MFASTKAVAPFTGAVWRPDHPEKRRMACALECTRPTSTKNATRKHRMTFRIRHLSSVRTCAHTGTTFLRRQCVRALLGPEGICESSCRVSYPQDRGTDRDKSITFGPLVLRTCSRCQASRQSGGKNAPNHEKSGETVSAIGQLLRLLPRPRHLAPTARPYLARCATGSATVSWASARPVQRERS